MSAGNILCDAHFIIYYESWYYSLKLTDHADFLYLTQSYTTEVSKPNLKHCHDGSWESIEMGWGIIFKDEPVGKTGARVTCE